LPGAALDDLRFIRETMERSSTFTAVPGWGMVLVGVTALAAGLLAAWQGTPARWTAIWLGEACLAVAIGSLAISVKSQRQGMPLWNGPARKVAFGFLPAIGAAAVLSVVFYRSGLTASLPGLWCLLYGAGVVSGGIASVPVVPVMGACFVVSGVAALVSPAWGNVIMTGSFSLLHILFGVLIARRHGG
jgi:hypothetical protein